MVIIWCQPSQGIMKGIMLEELGLDIVRSSALAKVGGCASLAEELDFDSICVAGRLEWDYWPRSGPQ